MISLIRFLIDRFIYWMKWPCAVFMLLAVPSVGQVFKHYYAIHSQLHFQNLLYFAIGAAFFLFARIAFVARRGCAETMEHETTHTLFALLTLHPVHGMTVNDHGGGSMSFSGGSNWLIALAPYFFPLMAFGMMLLAIVINGVAGYTPDWIYIGLGCAVGYNLFSFVQQTHPGQTDFKAAGYLFTVCFLPGANMIVYGTIVAFAERGSPGIHYFFKLLFYFMKKDVLSVWNYVSGGFGF